MPAPPTTRVIELTPTGRAAVAVVLVSGPDAVRCVNECFCRADGRQLESFASGRILVGRWGAPDGEELVVCRRSDEEVEVHCHGGVAAVRAVVDLLCERGCASTHWQDWLGESEADPIRTAAQIELADAPTARTAAVLLDQYQGALSSAIRSVLDAAAAGEWETASAALDAILVQRGVGLHLTKPWRVVLAGRPNVGKSSLMNALVGFQRAIVCDLPGTTRDVVTAMTAIDGWPIQLADTAGLRSTRDEIELAGVTRATAAAGAADLVLLVEDAQGNNEVALPTTTRVLRVLNKIDLPQAQLAAGERRFDVRCSAVTGKGVADLVAAIGHALVPLPPTADAAVPFTAEQVARLEQARSAARERDAGAVTRSLQSFVR
jgi:tRNA modification GTPase